MCRYVFSYKFEEENEECFLKFPAFPEIITSINKKDLHSKSAEEIEEYAHGAVIAALQAIITMRDNIPESNDPGLVRADGFVRLSVGESMKLELSKIYKENCKSVAEFSRVLGKPATAARRLLDLNHKSTPSEIENAVRVFGKRLAHDWHLEDAPVAA